MRLTDDLVRGIDDFKLEMGNTYAEYLHFKCSGEVVKHVNENVEVALRGMCDLVESLNTLCPNRSERDTFKVLFTRLVDDFSKLRELIEQTNEIDKIDTMLSLCKDRILSYNEYSLDSVQKSLFVLYARGQISMNELDKRLDSLYDLARRHSFYLCKGKNNLHRAYKDMSEEIDKPKTLKLEKYINQAIEESMEYKDKELEIKFRELDARLASKGLREMSLFN